MSLAANQSVTSAPLSTSTGSIPDLPVEVQGEYSAGTPAALVPQPLRSPPPRQPSSMPLLPLRSFFSCASPRLSVSAGEGRPLFVPARPAPYPRLVGNRCVARDPISETSARSIH